MSNQKMMEKILFIFLSICLLNNSTANSFENTVELIDFKDGFSNKVDVSGSIKVGVMYESIKDLNDNSFYIYTDDSFNMSNSICIEVNSIDGKYFAYGFVKIYEITDNIKVKLETKHYNELKKYSEDEIVILASVENDCKVPNRKTKYLPVSWAKKKNKTLNIFINSSSENTYYAIDNQDSKYKCINIKSNKLNTAYNTKCIINNFENQNIRIIREDMGSELTPVYVNILSSDDK